VDMGREYGDWEWVSRHHPTRGSGERRKLPQRGPGRSPTKNGSMHCIFEVRNKPSGTPLSLSLSDGGAPKRRGALKTFPPPPLDGSVLQGHI